MGTISAASAKSWTILAEKERARIEADLVRALRRERGVLRELLEGPLGRMAYSDSVYRFWHHSYKVYGLQLHVERIVAALGRLAPGRVLNPSFTKIVKDGTGRTFTLAANKRWVEETRPIVDAFFHARFFLEMAVRYGALRRPPVSLSSGYAALLCLYEIR